MARKLRAGPACYHVFHMVPPMAGHEMNFFYDEGLHDAEGEYTYQIVPHGLAPFTFELTLGQRIKEQGMDLALDVHPSTVLHLRHRGHKLFIVSGWRNQRDSHLISTSSIKELGDLRGKRVGLIDFKDNLYISVAPWLQRAGINLEEVVWTRGVNPQRAPEALLKGEVDAAFVQVPSMPPLLERGFVHLFDPQAHYPNGRPDRIIVATERALEEKADLIQAFIRGMIRSYWFCRTQPENFVYLYNLERRLRIQSPDPDEVRRKPGDSPQHMERWPFPIDGIATAMGEYVRDMVQIGELAEEDSDGLEQAVRQEIARDAFTELAARPDMQETLARMREVVARIGY